MGYNTLYLIGIFLSFCVGFAGLWISISNTRRTGYINSITSSRIQYIQDIRNAVSEFCGLIYNYRFLAGELTVFNYPPEARESRKKELSEIRKRIDYLKYLIRLYLNVEDKYFDPKIIVLLDEIIALSDKNAETKINELMIIMQYLLKLEWEGAKLESQKGIVRKREKNKLYLKYSKLHEKYKQKQDEENEEL